MDHDDTNHGGGRGQAPGGGPEGGPDAGGGPVQGPDAGGGPERGPDAGGGPVQGPDAGGGPERGPDAGGQPERRPGGSAQAPVGGPEPRPGASGRAGGQETRIVQDDPAAMLAEVRRLRRDARAARHGYWFPLVLFGLLTCASAPFYLQSQPRTGSYLGPVPLLTALGGLGAPGWQGYLSYYWLAAIMAGLGLTGLWYRRRGRKAGVATPSRGYLLITAALVVLALVPWLLFRLTGGTLFLFVLPGNLMMRGTFPFVIIALGLWVLARAERSWALLAIAVVYTATALLASLYDIENLLFRLGWNPTGSGISLASLPNVLLPALVLLAGGAGALIAQRRPRALS